MKKSKTVRPGDLVEVKRADEILQTLDSNGTMNHLPFMPEMIEFCGRTFRVSQRALKTCCYVKHSDMRKFAADDVVTLEGVRCSGLAHDGCQKSCTIFWRDAWLSKVEDHKKEPVGSTAEAKLLRARLLTQPDPNRYFCQASELLKATRQLSQRERIHVALKDVQERNCSALQMVSKIAPWIYWKIRRRVLGACGRGTGKAAPNEPLGLQIGELIEIKPIQGISQTLNSDARNRGLLFMPGMSKQCGQRHAVARKIEKIIMDGTGEMRLLRGTVFLEDSLCGCAAVAFGGCPRAEYAYWREDWLKRIAA